MKKPKKLAKESTISKSEANQAALTQAITEIKQKYEFFHDLDGEPWCRVFIKDHYENLPIRGQKFELLITKSLRESQGMMPSKSDVKQMLREFEGNAIFDGPECTLHLRTAATSDAIFVDLGDAQWNVVKITSDGWSLMSEEVSVRFRRSEGMRPLPKPLPSPLPARIIKASVSRPEHRKELLKKFGASKNLLQYLFDRFVNIQNKEHQILVLTWLVAAFRPKGPYPILAFHGRQGSAKTTAQTLLKKLIDPSIAPMRAAPRDERDLLISAKHSYVLGFDNLSDIPNWLSDSLCRLVTGGGLATRQLYTDSRQTVFDGARAIMLNGIDNIAERGDLLDRMLVVHCGVLETAKRRPEDYLSIRFSQLYPYFLGALFDVVSKTLAKREEILDTTAELFPNGLPRMADFAVWSIAAEEALGYKAGEFISAYEANRQELRHMALECSPAISALIDWKRGTTIGNGFRRSGHLADWTGTNQELLRLLGNCGVRTPKALSAEIARAEPNLRAIGIFIDHLPREAGTGRRRICITDAVQGGNRSARAKICDAYRLAHPECENESNKVVYKRATKQGTFNVTTVTPSQADAAKV